MRFLFPPMFLADHLTGSLHPVSVCHGCFGGSTDECQQATAAGEDALALTAAATTHDEAAFAAAFAAAVAQELDGAALEQALGDALAELKLAWTSSVLERNLPLYMQGQRIGENIAQMRAWQTSMDKHLTELKISMLPTEPAALAFVESFARDKIPCVMAAVLGALDSVDPAAAAAFVLQELSNGATNGAGQACVTPDAWAAHGLRVFNALLAAHGLSGVGTLWAVPQQLVGNGFMAFLQSCKAAYEAARTDEIKAAKAAGQPCATFVAAADAASLVLAAGFSPEEVTEASYTVKELRAGGVSLATIRASGRFDLAQCLEGGFSADECAASGFA